MGNNAIEVLYAENKLTAREQEVLKKIIPLRYKESEGFKSEQVRSAHLLGRYMTVTSLNCKEEDIYNNSYGKPYCKNGIYFNVSHTADYVVYVKSEDKIGIDIERVDKRLNEIIDYAFSQSEKDYIRSTTDENEIIYRATLLWTIKESVFKASGVEKGLEPKEIPANDSDKVTFMGEDYYILHKDFQDSIITIASRIRYNELVLNKISID